MITHPSQKHAGSDIHPFLRFKGTLGFSAGPIMLAVNQPLIWKRCSISITFNFLDVRVSRSSVVYFTTSVLRESCKLWR